MIHKARLTSLVPLLACLATANSLCAESAPAAVELKSVRVWSVGQVTRIAIQLTGDVEFKRDQIVEPPRLFVDLQGCAIRLDPGYSRVMNVDDPLVGKIRIALNKPTVARVVFDLKVPVDYEISQLASPPRIMVELRAQGGARPQPTDRSQTVSTEISRAETPSAPVEAAKTGSAAKDPVSPEPKRQASRTPPVDAAKSAPKPLESAPAVPEPKLTAAAPAPKLPAAAPAPGPETAPSTAATIPPRQKDPEPAPAAPAPKSAELVAPPKPADPGRGPRTSMTRALGLKLNRVVIDPGHGGHDHGTTGPGGLVEKELVLDVAKRLGALIAQHLGAEVVYTRQDDRFIPLEERTAIANQHRSDLFLSVHVNSSPLRSISGPEVYYLNFTDSKADLEVAARENAGHGKSIFELSELLQKIARTDKMEESREFARRVQRELYRLSSPSGTLKNRGVKKAPFVVLIGASMPSVLAEIGFVTNQKEESLLKRSEYRDRIAQALYQGVESYASTLSKMTIAREASTPGASTKQ